MSSATPRERLLTKAEMLEALGVGETKLSQLVKAGVVRRIKLGHRTHRYAASEIARLAESGGAPEPKASA